MIRKVFLILILFSFSFFSYAQLGNNINYSSYISNESSLVKSYTDSLLLLRKRILNDSTSKYKHFKKDISEEARLFLPTTYYRDIVHNAFAIDSNDEIDNNLLAIYLQNPYLVGTTDRNLKAQKESQVDVEEPIRQDVEIVDKVAPKPVESKVAPVEVMVMQPNFWTYKGDYSLQILQNYVSGNWYKGGESNYSALAALLMEANYNNKQKIKWENRLELKFGMQRTKSVSLHSFKTTEDLIRLTSKFGLQATKKWYYAVQLIAYSQFTHSYRSNDPVLYADFLAPLNVNLSLGMDYSVDWLNHKLKGNIHLAPLAYNMKYTRLKDLARRLGIDEHRHVKHDYGSEFTVDLEWKLMETLTWKTRLYGYTTYKRAELEWENTFTLRFNKYISAKFFLYPRFDDGVTRDGHHGYWQLKEFASIGFQYSF